MGLSVIEEQHNGMDSIFELQAIMNHITDSDNSYPTGNQEYHPERRTRPPAPVYPLRSTDILTQIAANHSGNV